MPDIIGRNGHTCGIGYTRIEPLTGGAARLAVKSASNADATDKVTDGRRRIRPVAETGQRGAKPPMPEPTKKHEALYEMTTRSKVLTRDLS